MELTWPQLLSWDLTSPDVYFVRRPDVTAAYEAQKQEFAGRDYSAYIMETMLGSNAYALTENAFPYLLEPNIKHMVFWMQPGNIVPMEQAKKIVECIVYGVYNEVVVISNVPANMSIRGVPHYQVFVHHCHPDTI